MSLNNSHQNGGIVLYQCENLSQSRDDIGLEFHGDNLPKPMNTVVKGKVFLTTHRVIFKTDRPGHEGLKSFSMPFFCLTGVELKQPIFGANAIKGKIEAEPDGGWEGTAEFRLTFNHGGAIEFGQHMLKIASNAPRLPHNPAPLSSAYGHPPSGGFYPPPPGMYGQYPPTGYGPQYTAPYTQTSSEAPPPYTAQQTSDFPSAPPDMYQSNGGAFYNPTDPQSVFVTPSCPPPPYEEPTSESKKSK